LQKNNSNKPKNHRCNSNQNKKHLNVYCLMKQTFGTATTGLRRTNSATIQTRST
ncbi:hypothetical protein S245_039568, partial [Arachis hypogaea]